MYIPYQIVYLVTNISHVYILYVTGESEEKRKTNKLTATTTTTTTTYSSKNNKNSNANNNSSGDIFMLSGATLTAGYCHMVVIAVGENSR